MPTLTLKSNKGGSKDPEKATLQGAGPLAHGEPKRSMSLSSQFKNLFKSPKLSPQMSDAQNTHDEENYFSQSHYSSNSKQATSPGVVSSDGSLRRSSQVQPFIGEEIEENPTLSETLASTGLVPIPSDELITVPQSRSRNGSVSMSRNGSVSMSRNGSVSMSRSGSVSRRTRSREPSRTRSRESSMTRRSGLESSQSRRGSADGSKVVKAFHNAILVEGSFRLFEDGSHDHVLKTSKVLEKIPTSSGILSGFLRKSTNTGANDVAFSLLPEQNRMDFQRRLSIQSRKTFDEEDENNLDQELEDDGEDEFDDDYDDSSDDEDFDLLHEEHQPFNRIAAISDPQLSLITRLTDMIKNQEDPVLHESKGYKLTEKYGKVQGIIGKGSYGIVKLVSKYDPSTKKDLFYAVKELKLKEGEDIEHFSTRLTSEFVISNSLNHLNVIKALDLMQNTSGVYSEIMEYCAAGDLFSLISKTQGEGLYYMEADCFMKQVMNGLTYMHSKGVAHCDLKPENILLTTSGVAKITDFGTSAVFRTAWENEIHLSSGACGSEPYVAPEEFRNVPYDPRLVDIWAAGVLYLTMVTGTYVWVIAKESEPLYAKYLKTRPIPGKVGTFEPIESLKFGDENYRSRKQTLYGMLDPNTETRFTGKHVLNSVWMKDFRLCEAAHGSDIHW